jgi:hypothetical protein
MFAASALAGMLALIGGWSGPMHASSSAPGATEDKQVPAPLRVKFSQITPAELTEYLTYLASDQLTGRQIYTEGYGLAAGYIAAHLQQWGVKPIGENGTYLQTVKNRGYKVTRNSTVTVEVGGQTRTFKQGEHVTFPMNSGGKQTVSFSGAQFALRAFRKTRALTARSMPVRRVSSDLRRRHPHPLPRLKRSRRHKKRWRRPRPP